MKSNFLFLYGTLLRELRGNIFYDFEEYNRYVGEAWIPGKLYEIRNYPGMIPSLNKKEKVYGEVYEILDENYLLTKLDDYEGYSVNGGDKQEYIRKMAYVTLNGVARKRCWVYVYNQLIHHYEFIPSGSYKMYRSNKALSKSPR